MSKKKKKAKRALFLKKMSRIGFGNCLLKELGITERQIIAHSIVKRRDGFDVQIEYEVHRNGELVIYDGLIMNGYLDFTILIATSNFPGVNSNGKW